MKPNTILIFGSLLVLSTTVLWYFDIISEPVAAIAGSLFTVLGLILARNQKGASAEKKVKQKNTGSGEIVGGDKMEVKDSGNVIQGLSLIHI